MAPPNALVRKGIDTALLKVGAAITVDAWMPKGLGRSSDLASGRTLTLADGRQLDVGDSLNWTLLTAPPTPTR
jgi:hypothetical protein